MTKAAMKMIPLYCRFFRCNMLTIYWQAVENLFSAGTALMYAYVQSAQVREIVTLHSLESLVHTCSSVLWGMVERFPLLQSKRDAFDATALEVLADLNASHPTGGAPGQTLSSEMRCSSGLGAQNIPFNVSAVARDVGQPDFSERNCPSSDGVRATTIGPGERQAQRLPNAESDLFDDLALSGFAEFDDGMSLVLEATSHSSVLFAPTWI